MEFNISSVCVFPDEELAFPLVLLFGDNTPASFIGNGPSYCNNDGGANSSIVYFFILFYLFFAFIWHYLTKIPHFYKKYRPFSLKMKFLGLNNSIYL